MLYTSADLERFLSAFYATTDAPFILGEHAFVPFACTLHLLALIIAPDPETPEEIADAMQLPLGFVEAIHAEIDVRGLRQSSSWAHLIEVLKKGDWTFLQEAIDAVVTELWMRDLPEFDTVAENWLKRQPAFTVGSWWTDPATRPVSEDGQWYH